MLIKYGENLWNAYWCFLNLVTVGEGLGQEDEEVPWEH